MKKQITKLSKYLHANWNSWLAGIALFGYLVFTLIPNFQEYTKWFIFLAVNAILWTVVELKVVSSKIPKARRYKDMREARQDILTELKSAISKRHKNELEVVIIGGRIRTISDILRELVNDLNMELVHAKNVKFKLYCLDPKFIDSWNFSNFREDSSFKQKASGYAHVVTQLRNEIQGFNNLEVFKANNISLEIIPYCCFPTIYAYVIGKKRLFWGYYIWNQDLEDFEGPTNPCYFLDSDSEFFDDYRQFILNRAEFLQLSNQSLCEGPPIKPEQDLGSKKHTIRK